MSRPKIVLLGMLTKMPVGGVMWLVRQYAVGFQRLGYDVYYVEAHGRVPSMFMENEHDDATGRAVAFLADQMRRNGMEDRWAFHAVHDDGRCYGLSRAELDQLYRDAALIINLHGGTVPLEEHSASGRLVYMGTDPVDLELELHRGEQRTIDFLEPHVAFFTWGLNYGNPDCRLPWSERFQFVASPPPVVLDLWQDAGGSEEPAAFTTVGNWRQPWRQVTFEGEVYTWSKHHEFLKILDLPRRVRHRFELALSSCDEADLGLLEANGWAVRSGLEVSADPDEYRRYIAGSRGELTVAKDQNVRLRTGWFSERSATYLAAGRPVIQQDTGFGNAFPTGKGVYGFSDLEGAVAAVEAVNADYPGNRRAATEVARDYFNYDVVLGGILDHMGLDVPVRSEGIRGRPLRPTPLTRPLEARALLRPIPALWPRRPPVPVVTILTETADDLASTRLSLETLLAETSEPLFEVIVADDGSTAETWTYLTVLAARNRNVHPIRRHSGDSETDGQTISSVGEILVFMAAGAIVTPGWLTLLSDQLLNGSIAVAEAATICVRSQDQSNLCPPQSFERNRSGLVCVAVRRQPFEPAGPSQTPVLCMDDMEQFDHRIRQ